MKRSARRTRLVWALFVGVVSVTGPSGHAQSMGEAARQEKERRAKIAKPAKVYTDSDLPGKGSPDKAAPPQAAAPPEKAKAGLAPSSEAVSAEDEAAERKRLEAEWRIRFADARRKIAEAELRCWHSVVRTVFVAGIPVQQWVKEFEESEELRQAKNALVDLEEEFRRTGYPPGWTRE
jgi:hypothetical protein